jgi:ribosomal protein S27AE
MPLQTDVPASRSGLALFPFFQRPACPRCGDTMFAATATEYFGQGRIHHSWSCEICQHEFQTAVEMPSNLQ